MNMQPITILLWPSFGTASYSQPFSPWPGIGLVAVSNLAFATTPRESKFLQIASLLEETKNLGQAAAAARAALPSPLQVHAGSFRISIIHRTPTWTTGSLTCVRVHSYVCVYTRGVWAHRQRVGTTFLTPDRNSNHRPLDLQPSALTTEPTRHPKQPIDHLACRAKLEEGR